MKNVPNLARFRNYIINRIELFIIESDVDTVQVKDIGNNSVASSSEYGVNGTFFWPLTNGNSTGIALQNGTAVRSEATNTQGYYSGNTYIRNKRGTLYCLNNGTIGTAVIHDKNELSNNIRWAISGYSLHLNKDYTQNQYYDAINAYEKPNPQDNQDTENTHRLNAAGSTQRTAIGYRTWNDPRHGLRHLIGMVYFDTACSAWEVRDIMKNRLGYRENPAIMLDGGGSSGIRGIEENQTQPSSYPSGQSRHMLTMPTFNNVTWE